MEKVKLVLTGAHFTPAQAVIKELQKDKDIEIVYIGRKTTREGDPSLSVESEIVPKLGVKFIPLVTGRVQRIFTIYTIPSLFKIPVGIIQAFWILLQEKPEAVLSFGGYVAVPVVISAWLLNIPIIVHEQTLVSGLANRISSFFADKIAVTFATKYAFNPKKIILTGNPIRSEIIEPTQPPSSLIRSFFELAKKDKKAVVLVTGGSQGAHTINQAVFDSLAGLTENFYIIHQTGDSKFKDFEKSGDIKQDLKNPDRYLSLKQIDVNDLSYIFRQIAICVSRAGANTLLELSYFGIPTLLIPLPFVTGDEQTVNANFFAKLGLAKILKQEDLSGKSLVLFLNQMSKQLGDLRRVAANAKKSVLLNGDKRLALEILKLTSY